MFSNWLIKKIIERLIDYYNNHWLQPYFPQNHTSFAQKALDFYQRVPSCHFLLVKYLLNHIYKQFKMAATANQRLSTNKWIQLCQFDKHGRIWGGCWESSQITHKLILNRTETSSGIICCPKTQKQIKLFPSTAAYKPSQKTTDLSFIQKNHRWTTSDSEDESMLPVTRVGRNLISD